jgi:hypothetical protein
LDRRAPFDEPVARRTIDEPGEISGGDEHASRERRERLPVLSNEVREEIEPRHRHLTLELVSKRGERPFLERQNANPNAEREVAFGGRRLGGRRDRSPRRRAAPHETPSLSSSRTTVV